MNGNAHQRKLGGIVLAWLVFCGPIVGAVTVTGASTAVGNTVSVGDATAEAGTNVTVTVSVDRSDVSTYAVSLQYDTAVVSVASVAGGSDTAPDASIDESRGWVNVSGDTDGSITDGTLARITFDIVADEGETSLRVEPDATELTDADGHDIPIGEYQDGAISVEPAATPTATPSPTETAEPTPSETPTDDQGEDPTPTASPTPTATPAPSDSSQQGSDGGGGASSNDGGGSSNDGGGSSNDGGASSNGGGSGGSEDVVDESDVPSIESDGSNSVGPLSVSTLWAILAVLLTVLVAGIGMVLVRRRRSRGSKLDW